jgi:hypothetical protein
MIFLFCFPQNKDDKLMPNFRKSLKDRTCDTRDKDMRSLILPALTAVIGKYAPSVEEQREVFMNAAIKLPTSPTIDSNASSSRIIASKPGIAEEFVGEVIDCFIVQKQRKDPNKVCAVGLSLLSGNSLLREELQIPRPYC